MSETPNNNTTTATTDTTNTNSVPTKAEAAIDQHVGAAKETIGNAVGNTEMQANGLAQKNEGHQKEAANNVAGFFNKINNEVQGTVKGLFSALSGKSSEKK